MAQQLHETDQHQDVMPLLGIDHVEFYVGNAKQAAYYYAHAFGFAVVAYAGLETGLRDRVSHVLQQGRIRLVLTGTLHDGTEIGEHQRRHGDETHDEQRNNRRTLPAGNLRVPGTVTLEKAKNGHNRGQH